MTARASAQIHGFTGEILVPGGAAYEAAAAIWNMAVDRRPAVIARCRTPADVSAVIRHAADHGRPLSVRAGGHNFAGTAIADGGIVADLRGLRGLRVDPVRLTATIEAGLTWGEVDPELHRHGLAATGGSVSKVGVSGFTLGSGLGWLSRHYGLAGDNVLGAEVVTADGAVLSVGPAEHPDLYWAVRGGTGGFGVVTSWTMRLFPMGVPLAGTLLYPLDRAPTVLAQLLSRAAAVPDTVTWTAVLTTAPPQEVLPSPLAGRPVLLISLLFTGPPDKAADLTPLRAIGRPVAGRVGPVPLRIFNSSIDAAAPDGMAWDVRSEWVATLDDTAIEHAAAIAAIAPSPLSQIVFRPLGGAIAAPAAPETPFSYRHAGLLAEIIANAPAGTREPHRAWLEDGLSGLLRMSAGGPDVNHIGLDEDPARVATAYSASARGRLRSVKAAYDPGNLFRSVPYPLAAQPLSVQRRRGFGGIPPVRCT